MKLNAEELAVKRFPILEKVGDRGTTQGTYDLHVHLETIRRNAYADAITEVAQPLQDRVEELEAALRAILELQYSSRLDEAIDAARAILAKHA